MDTILSRKLFREKYVKEIKPKKISGGITVLKLATGGEVFSEGEKIGYMLAPVAASLLQAKQKPGESALASLFGAVGEGVSQVPAVGLNIKKLEIAGQPKQVEKVRNLTTDEVKAARLPAGTIAQIDSSNKINIISKPSEKEIQESESLLSNINTLNQIDADYKRLGKPVGPWYNLDPEKIGGFVSGIFGGEYGKEVKQFNSNLSRFETDYIKLTSGLTVSDKERANLEKFLPSASDTESMFEAKTSALKGYYSDLIKIKEAQGLQNINLAAKALESKGVSINDYAKPTTSGNVFRLGADGELQRVK
jgi:hypothetical protein